MTLDRNKAARDILAFYVEAGIDAVLGEEPIDRFAAPAEAALPATPRVPVEGADGLTARPPLRPAARQAPPLQPTLSGMPTVEAAAASPNDAAMAAREAARSAKTLDELKAILGGFQGCALRTTAQTARLCRRQSTSAGDVRRRSTRPR